MNNGRDGGGDGVRKREETGRKNNRKERGGRDGAANEDGGRSDRKFYVC